jgi:uncharacterized protein
MTIDRLFLDTAFIQALLNPRDDFHDRAKNLFPQVRNALSAFNRPGAVKFIQLCYSTENIQVVMQQHNLTDAMTSDRHFVQAGFHALMLEAN